MNRITPPLDFENTTAPSIEAFLNYFGIVSILQKVGAYKQKGIGVRTLFTQLFSLAFGKKTMISMVASAGNTGKKDAYYRFINSPRINWLRFTMLLAASIVNRLIGGLTDLGRVNVFIVDDTVYERAHSKKVELLSRVHDHTRNRFVKGFRLLTLGWSDGNTFLPVSGCLLSSKPEKQIAPQRPIDKRTCGYSLRRLAQTKAPDVMLEMLQGAAASGLKASYVLFDSWFAHPATILSVLREKLHVIAMLKKTSKVHFRFQGRMVSVTHIYERSRKRPGRSKYLLSCDVEIRADEYGEERFTPARLVFVRNRNRKSEYLVMISTDITLSPEEIIRIYGKRWDIEVFFKVCKSNLRLTEECQSMNYDAMMAYVAIVFARYMFLASERRIAQDDRTMGDFMGQVFDEMQDITTAEALRIILGLLLETVYEVLALPEEQISSLFERFLTSLPNTLKKKLCYVPS